MDTTHDDPPGRCYLVAFNGEPIHPPRSCYLMTKVQAETAAMQLRVTYGGGGRYSAVQVDCAPKCEKTYPGNGSYCELNHGHEGLCSYSENHGRIITWVPGA